MPEARPYSHSPGRGPEEGGDLRAAPWCHLACTWLTGETPGHGVGQPLLQNSVIQQLGPLLTQAGRQSTGAGGRGSPAWPRPCGDGVWTPWGAARVPAGPALSLALSAFPRRPLFGSTCGEKGPGCMGTRPGAVLLPRIRGAPPSPRRPGSLGTSKALPKPGAGPEHAWSRCFRQDGRVAQLLGPDPWGSRSGRRPRPSGATGGTWVPTSRPSPPRPPREGIPGTPIKCSLRCFW